MGWIFNGKSTIRPLHSNLFDTLPASQKLRSQRYPGTFGAHGLCRQGRRLQPWTSCLHGIKGQNEKGNETTKALPAAHCERIGRLSSKKNRKQYESYEALSSCKTSTQAFSVDVRTQVSRILVRNNWCKCGHAQIQQCKQSESRGPSHHPTAF